MADQEFAPADSFQGPAELRSAYERAVKALKGKDDHIASLEGEMRGFRIARAGFKEGSEGHRLLSDFYQGDLADTEKMLEFAGKYGLKPGVPAAGSGSGKPDEVEGGDLGLAALQGAGTPIIPAGEPERLAAEIVKAEQEHRLSDAIRLKNQLQRLLQPSRG